MELIGVGTGMERIFREMNKSTTDQGFAIRRQDKTTQRQNSMKQNHNHNRDGNHPSPHPSITTTSLSSHPLNTIVDPMEYSETESTTYVYNSPTDETMNITAQTLQMPPQPTLVPPMYLPKYVPPPQQFSHHHSIPTTTKFTGLFEAVFGPNTKCMVKQKIEDLEILTGWETQNAYAIKFENGCRGMAKEHSSLAWRSILEARRPFKMHVTVMDPRSNQMTPLMTLKRPYKFIGGLLEVKDGNNQLIGTVKKRFSLRHRKFVILDPIGVPMYSIKAKHIIGRTFTIYDLRHDKLQVGEIKKKWAGFLQEMYTDADNYGIQFPVDATPKEKALILSATFLIDYIYFENNQHYQA